MRLGEPLTRYLLPHGLMQFVPPPPGQERGHQGLCAVHTAPRPDPNAGPPLQAPRTVL